MAKSLNKKLPQVSLNISLRGIKMVDTVTSDLHLDFSIYRISYCSVDPTLQHIFTFIATNQNLTMECHAFLCHKKKIAQSATLTIAQAFNLAFEEWMRDKNRKKKRDDGEDRKRKIGRKDEGRENKSDDIKREEYLAETKGEDLLIDLGSLNYNDDAKTKLITNVDNFGEKESEEMDLSFTQIAQRNTAIPMLSKLPENASSLELGSFINCGSDAPGHSSENAGIAQVEKNIFTIKDSQMNIWN